MAVTTSNVIIGACTSFQVDGNDLGATSGGVTVEKKQTFVDIQVDQSTGVVVKAVKEETYTITTELAEATLNNLQIAFGLGSAPVVSTSPANTTLDLEAQGGAAIEHTLTFVGPCPPGTASYTTRTFSLNRAVNVTATKIEMARDKETLYQVAFQCLPDLTQTGHEYGTVVDA